MSTELIFYTPLTGSITVTTAADLQGDAAPPTYSNVTDFTASSNILGLQVAAADLTNLFTVENGVASTICTGIFTSLLASGENDFFNSSNDTVTLGGIGGIRTLKSLAADLSVSSLAEVENNRGLVDGTTPTVSTSGDTFAALFEQVNSNSNFVQNFYNDSLNISGAAAASAITFLVEYDVTKNYVYTINASDYPSAPAGTYFYYDRVTGAQHSLTSLTDTVSGTVRFALRFNVA